MENNRYLILVHGPAANALADVVITYEISNTESKEIPSGSVIKISLSERNLRWDMADLISMIYRKDGSFLLIDHKERFFLDMGRMMNMLERMQKEMESQLAQVPPEQRKMMEAMMGGMMKRMMEQQMTEPCEDPRVIKDEKVNGIPAKVVDGCKTIVNGRWQTCRFWLADGKRLGLKQDDLRLLLDFMEYQKKALSRVSSFAEQMMGGISFSYQPARERILNLPYKLPFVVKTATVENEKERWVIILKDIRFVKVPDRVFVVPQGYKDETPKMTGYGGGP